MVSYPCLVLVYEEKLERIKKLLEQGFESAVTNETTAKLLSQLLGAEVSTNQREIKVKYNDKLIVFQTNQQLLERKVLTEEELQQISYQFLIIEPITGEVV